MGLEQCEVVQHLGVARPPRAHRLLVDRQRQYALGLFHAGRFEGQLDRRCRVVEVALDLPAEVGGLSHGLGCGARCGHDDQHIGARRLQLHHLRIDGRIGDLESSLRNDLCLRLAGKPFLQPLEHLASQVVVLHQHGDFRVRVVFNDVPCEDTSLALIAAEERHGPGILCRIVEHPGPRLDEQLRHLLRVHVALDGRVGCRAQVAEDGQHLVFLDQATHHLDRLGRRVLVVVDDQLNFSPVDATGLVELLEVGLRDLADHRVARDRA